MAFELPPLPYAPDALAPHITEQTIGFHYGKHHQAYVNNLNGLVDGTDNAGKSLEEIVMNSEGGVFNNAAQIWNHTFYWHSMSPAGGGDPAGALADALGAAFGSVDAAKQEFATKAKTLFGSGWTWLVKNADGSVAITQTGNADLPMKHGQTALLTIDVWEHAYYLDYQNRRPDYVKDFIAKLLNWDFATANFDRARK
jgi:Fe-Mn family superoxide dismutase